jgi:uncharacterized HAD superfamily protein
MQHLVITVDCDDVIVESSFALLEHYSQTYGVDVPPELLYTASPAQWGVAHDDEAIARVYKYLRSEDSQAKPPSPAAIQALRRLAADHELHLVTGRADFLQASTLAWLKKYLDGVFSSTEFTNYIVPTSHKHITRSKAEVCKQLNADILIEDHPHHAEIVAATGTDVLLFGDLPWNRHATLTASGVTRVKDWAAVVSHIDRTATDR